MENTELIKALRCCGHNMIFHYCDKEDCQYCQYSYYENLHICNVQELGIDAADALEADNERIVNLLTALYLANEKLAYVDCQPYTEIDGEEMIDDWVKTLVYEELKAQLPKEAHWVAVDNGHGVCSNCNRQDSIDNMATHCRYCGARLTKGEHDEN